MITRGLHGGEGWGWIKLQVDQKTKVRSVKIRNRLIPRKEEKEREREGVRIPKVLEPYGTERRERANANYEKKTSPNPLKTFYSLLEKERGGNQLLWVLISHPATQNSPKQLN